MANTPPNLTNPYTPDAPPPQAPGVTGKGGRGLTAAVALLQGFRKGYLDRQYRQFEQLSTQWKLARYAKDEAERNVTEWQNIHPGEPVPPNIQNPYNAASAQLEQAIGNLQKMGGSPGGARGGAANPQQSKLKNAGALLQRILFGPKVNFGLPQGFPGGAGVPKSTPPFMPGGAPPTGTPQPPQGPPQAGPPTSAQQGSIVTYNGRQYRVIGPDPNNPRNTILDPVTTQSPPAAPTGVP